MKSKKILSTVLVAVLALSTLFSVSLSASAKALLPTLEQFKTAMEGKVFVGHDSGCDLDCPGYARAIYLGKHDGKDVIYTARGTGSYYGPFDEGSIVGSTYPGAAYTVKLGADMVLDITCDTSGDITGIHIVEDYGDHQCVCTTVPTVDSEPILSKIKGEYSYQMNMEGTIVTLSCTYADGQFSLSPFGIVVTKTDKLFKYSNSEYILMDVDHSGSILAITVENGNIVRYINYGGVDLRTEAKPDKVEEKSDKKDTKADTKEQEKVESPKTGDTDVAHWAALAIALSAATTLFAFRKKFN